MKRKLNRKLFLWLLGSFVVLGIGIHFLHGAQVRRSAEVLLEQSKKAEEAKDIPRARDFLERYLAVQPDDITALIKLSELVEKSPSSTAATAARVMERALRVDPARDDIRKRVVRLWMNTRPPSYSGAKPHIDHLLESRDSKNRDDAEIRELAGRVEEGLGHFTEARDHYKAAIELKPDLVDVYTQLAELLRDRLNDAARANTVMDAEQQSAGGLITSNPSSARAYLARAAYRQRHAEIDKGGAGASSDIAKALSLEPQNPDVRIAAGLLERDRGALDVARRHLEAALKQAPERPEIYQTLSDLEVKAAGQAPDASTRTDRLNKAVAWLEQGTKKLEGSAALKYGLAAALAQANRLDEAQGIISDLTRAGIRPELIQYLNAYVLMHRKDYKEALKELQAAHLYLAPHQDMRDLDKRVLLMIGQCQAALGDVNGRYDAFRQAVNIDMENDPLWAEARLNLAETLQSQGKFDEAIQEYQLVLRGDRFPELRLPVARLMTMQNLQLPPEKQNWAFVENLLERLAAEKPESLEIPILLAEVHFARNRAPQARALLEKTRAAHPDRVEPWLALAGLAERLEEDSLGVLDAAQQALGPRVELFVTRAAYWARHKGPKAPTELLQLERVADGLPEADQNRLWREIATAYAQLSVYDRAHLLWQRLTERLPNDLATQMIGFDLALQAGDEENAAKDAARIQTLEGTGGILSQCAEALLLTRQANKLPATDAKRAEMLSRARDMLIRVAAKRPTWSRAAVALAEVALAQRLDDEALRHYLHAIDDLGDRSPATITAAAQILYRNKRLADAERMVRLLRDQNVPISGDLQRMVAEIAAQNRDYLRALEQAQELVPDDSDNPEDLIWLGRLRWAAGQADAERSFRRAVEVGQDKPETHLTLIAYLAMTNRKNEAITALAEAEKQLPPDRAVLVLAEGNELAGRADRAREYYEQAVKARPTDPTTLRSVASFEIRNGRFRDASEHLRTLVEKNPNSPDAAVARRTLVLITAASGNRQEAMKALESLGLSDSPGGGAMPGEVNLDDLRTKAQVLAMQPNRVRRQEAINILNQILNTDRPRGDDMFLLAQLHEANGQWEEARRTMEKLVELAPEPTYLASFARSLLRHDNLADARDYLTRLERVAPEQGVTLEIKARVLHAEGNDDEATRILREFAADNPARLLSCAQLLEGLQQMAPAEELYRAYVQQYESRDAAAVLVLASFLGRRGRTAEALDLIDEKVWNKLPPEMASNASVVMLYGSRSDATQFDRVDARLQNAISENPNAVSIQFDLANLRSLQERYDEAASIYRKTFEREPTRGVPLNNLAWLLALKGDHLDEALEAITKAIELEGETPELLDTRALVYLARNQQDEAIQDLENALVVQPRNAEMQFHLAQAYQKSGRAGEATEAFERATTLGLTVDKLHPLERPGFTRMAGQPGNKT